MKKKYITAIVGISFLVVLGVGLFLMWHVTDRCENVQCQLAGIMPRIASLQKEVEASRNTLGNEKQISKFGDIDFGYVGNDGSIVVVNESSKLVLLAKPTQVGSAVSWQCSAYPEKAGALALVIDCGKKFR